MTIDLYAALAASVGVLPAAWAADLTEPVEPVEGDVDLWVDRGDERRMQQRADDWTERVFRGGL